MPISKSKSSKLEFGDTPPVSLPPINLNREDRLKEISLRASWLPFMPDHALDSILDACDLPVNEEADGTSAQLEIGKQLASMDGMDHIDIFDFDNYAFINQEVGPIPTIKHNLFVAELGQNFFFAVFAVSPVSSLGKVRNSP